MMTKLARFTLILSLLCFSNCGFLGTGKIKQTASGQKQGNNGGEGGDNSTGSASPLSGGIPRFVIILLFPVSKNTCWSASANYFEGEKAAILNFAKRLKLSGPAGVGFYLTSACDDTHPITELDFPKGASSVGFYFKSNQEGSQSITVGPVSGPPIQPGSITFIVTSTGSNSTVPVSLRILGPTQADSGACLSYSAALFDSNNSPTSFTTATNILLSASGIGGKFYTGSVPCTGSEISSLSAPVGQSNAQFYFKSTEVGMALLHGSQASLSGDLNLLLGPGTPSVLSLSGSNVVPYNNCVLYTVSVRDAWGHLSAYSTDQTLNLSLTGMGAFYSNSNCSTAASSVLLPLAHSFKVIYYKSPTIGTAELNATIAGAQPGTLSVSVVDPTPDSPTQLGWVTPNSGTATAAGNCFGPLQVVLKNASGITLPLPATRTANLTHSGSGQFFSDVGCNTAISSTSTNVFIYFKDTVAETNIIRATDAQNLLVAAQVSLTISAGSASRLFLLPAVSRFVAGGNSVVRAVFADTYGNTARLGAATIVNLTQTGTPQGTFFDSSCVAALPVNAGASPLAFALNDSEKYFCYSATRAGQATILGSSPITTGGSANLTIDPGAPAKVVLMSGPSTLNVGLCGTDPYRFDLFDSYNNPTVAGSGGLDLNLTQNVGNFYGASGCSGAPIIIKNFPVGSGSQNVYFMSPTPGIVSATAGGTGLTPHSFNISVLQQNPTKITLSGASPLPVNSPADSVVGLCLGFDLKTFDGANVPRSVNASTQVNFSVSGVTSRATFYSDSSCASMVTSTTLAVGEQTKRFYFKGLSAGTVTLQAVAASLSQGSYQLSLSAGPAGGIIVVGPGSILGNTCGGPYHVTFVDAYSNPTASPGTTILSSGQGTGAFYRDSACTTNGSSIATLPPYIAVDVYFKDPGYGARNFTLSTSPAFGLVSFPVQIVAVVAVLGPLSPNVGVTPGGDLITINGAYLKDNTGANPSVTIGSFGACQIVSASQSQITCKTPAGSAGIYNVVVSNSLGAAIVPNAYTYVDCNSSSAIVSGAVSPVFLWEAYNRYNALQATGLYPMVRWWNPYYYDGSGMNFHNDGTTMLTVCRMMGYGGVNSLEAHGWSSPGDNATLNWIPGSRSWVIWNGNQSNSWILRFTCINQLNQSCYNNPAWVFR